MCLLSKLPNRSRYRFKESLSANHLTEFELAQIEVDRRHCSSGQLVTRLLPKYECRWSPAIRSRSTRMFQLRNHLLQMRNVRKLQLATRLQQERAKSSLPMNTVICFVRQQVRRLLALCVQVLFRLQVTLCGACQADCSMAGYTQFCSHQWFTIEILSKLISNWLVTD